MTARQAAALKRKVAALEKMLLPNQIAVHKAAVRWNRQWYPAVADSMAVSSSEEYLHRTVERSLKLRKGK